MLRLVGVVRTLMLLRMRKAGRLMLARAAARARYRCSSFIEVFF